MLTVTKLYARSFDLDHINVFWELADFDSQNDNILAFDFRILASESPSGPFEVIAGPFKDQYFLKVPCPPNLHKWRKIFYKLRITDTRTSEEKDYGPTAQLAEPDLIALEIQRQEDILFREFAGRLCWIFPVRTFGPKCTCYDFVTDRRMRSNCLTCYDTGYLGGYLAPVETFFQADTDPKRSELTSKGEIQNRNSTGRLISFPPVKPKDILVEAENRRWRIVSVSTTERLRAVVHQEILLHEIPPGDVEYKLPIGIDDITTIEFASERNFKNPQHPEDEDIQRVLDVHGRLPRGTTK